MKSDGRRIDIDSPVVVHEVLHSIVDFFDEEGKLVRNGLYVDENSRYLGEAVIDELCDDALSKLGDLPHDRHDFVNQLIQISAFKTWVNGCFSEEGLEVLKREVKKKFGDNGLGIIALFAEHNMSFELGTYVRTKRIKLPNGASKEVRDKFLAFQK